MKIKIELIIDADVPASIRDEELRQLLYDEFISIPRLYHLDSVITSQLEGLPLYRKEIRNHHAKWAKNSLPIDVKISKL